MVDIKNQTLKVLTDRLRRRILASNNFPELSMPLAHLNTMNLRAYLETKIRQRNPAAVGLARHLHVPLTLIIHSLYTHQHEHDLSFIQNDLWTRNQLCAQKIYVASNPYSSIVGSVT